MRKIILVLLLLGTCVSALKSQSVMTQMTTGKDNMEGIVNGKFNWFNLPPSTASKFEPPHGSTKCISPPRGEGQGRDGGGNIFITIWDWITSLFSCDEEGGDGGGGGGGGSGIGYGIGGISSIPSSAPSNPNNGNSGSNGSGGNTNSGSSNSSGLNIGGISSPPNITFTLASDGDNGSTTVTFGAPKDTLQPKKVPCKDSTDSIAKYVSNFMKDYIDSSAYMKKLVDSGKYKTKEIGFAINRNGTGKPNAPYIYSTKNYNGNGAAQNLNITTDWYTLSTVHLHPDDSGKNVPSPSPVDIKLLLLAMSDTGSYFSPFLGVFTVSGNSGKDQYALVGTDNNASQVFSSANNLSSLADTAATTPDGNPNPNLNNWTGDKNDKNTNLGKFYDAKKRFIKEGYPEKDADTYANVFMMSNNGGLKTGITMFKRDSNGNYKALGFELVDDPNPKKPKHYRIIICQ